MTTLIKFHVKSLHSGKDNCFAQSLSFITGIPVEGIPNFHKPERYFWVGVRDYLLAWDLCMMAYTPERAQDYGHILCSGKNQKGVQHIIVTDPEMNLLYDSNKEGTVFKGPTDKWVLMLYNNPEEAA